MKNIFLAQNSALEKLNTARDNAGYQGGTTPELGLFGIVSIVIKTALGLVGVIFLVLLIYAGFVYMTAGGDESKIEKATGTIRRSVIGILIVLLSYAFASFIIPRVLCATGVNNACAVSEQAGNELMDPDF